MPETIVFWNIQRASGDYTKREDRVVQYVGACLKALKPIVMVLCEVDAGGTIVNKLLQNLANTPYEGALFICSGGDVQGVQDQESRCSYFGICKKGNLKSFNTMKGVQTISRKRPSGVWEHVTARPLLVYDLWGKYLGFRHFISGNTKKATKQILYSLEHHVSRGCLLLGDININIGDAKTRCKLFTMIGSYNQGRGSNWVVKRPPYPTHFTKNRSSGEPIWNILDYGLWSEGVNNIQSVTMDGLMRSFMATSELKYSDHLPIGYTIKGSKDAFDSKKSLAFCVPQEVIELYKKKRSQRSRKKPQYYGN